MSSDSISVRGARQHNLKNIDVAIPLHRLTVLTGLSGSGKSSLAFDTLYAEGQRRYVETFSPYTRQFLERMDKPDVDRIDGIPPAIAIEQSNPVKTSRSTVGTLTEIADYSKMLMTHAARLECPKCQREIRPGNASAIAAQILHDCTGQEITIGFTVAFPRRPTLASVLDSLRQQGFVRVSIDGKIVRTDEPPTKNVKAPAELFVIQDRLTVDPKNRARLGEAVEVALRHGQGVVRVQAGTTELRFTDRWYCPYDQIEFKAPVPALFSFNNPLGACPICRGFGRTIEIDYELALPNRELSIAQGVVKPWQSGMSKECQKDLLRFCRKQGIPTDVPFSRLTRAQQRFVIDGESKPGIPQEDLWDNNRWYGVKGFFKWLETKTYKMHVRVFLSRYRVYKLCPTCHGARFQPETLQFKLASNGRKLDLAAINQLPLREAKIFFEQLPLPPDDEAAAQLRGEIVTRLSYLLSVGLGYLTLDRATRTLSGGEIQRVNLTSCLGNSLVNTLFVLDEPTIGLHPRDAKQLVDVVKNLRDRGNTLVVVEHEEALMREADHLVDLGPGRGELGGSVVYSGSYSGLVRSKKSLTGRYLSGETKIPLPVTRRQPRKDSQLNLRGASSHNLKNIDVDVPLGLFVAITGVSGSGKSTLVHDVLYANLLKAKNQAGHHSIEPGELREIRHADLISEVIEVDQSPLSRTSRSNPAVYLGVYDEIRKCFGETEAAVAQGLSASDFSFNGGNGRCPRCGGAGTERIEMQFLADVFITCPVCEGKRFQPHILALTYRGKSIDDVLKMTCHEARQFFSPDLPDLDPPQKRSHRKIGQTLEMIEQVSLGYLRLGQPLQQLSGGEAQRIKLLSYLREATERPRDAKANCGRLFILDEPTTGLHFEDIRLLIELLQKIVSQGDSLIVIEHNLDVIKCADWIIDLGPEAGDGGGLVVAAGTPEEIAQVESSHTGQYLRSKLVPGNRLRELPPLPAITKLRPLKNDRLIRIRGARHHNLKDISLDVHLDEMTVVTGLSGSGKSTLAFDLLFAEGQRRYLDSLNAYARQFVEPMEKPDVDSITGIPPAVAIEQRVTRGGHKSTIATVAEIHQFLRLLFAKIGRVFDPDTSEMAVRQTPEEIFHRLEKASRAGKLTLLAPLVRGRKGFHTDVARWASRKGYPLLRVDGRWIEPDKFKALDRYVEHTIDVVVGDLTASQSTAARRQLMHVALGLGHGTIYAIDRRKTETIYSTHLFCPSSGRSFDELEPRLFSFNSPHGWCPRCQGYGTLLG